MKHLHLQFIDFEFFDDLNTKDLAERALRFESIVAWEQQGNLENLLWYAEPEYGFEQGRFRVPRIKLSKQRNMRYNSSRRLLTHQTNLHDKPLTLVKYGPSYVLEECNRASAAQTRTDVVAVSVTHSILRAVKLGSSDYLFLAFGTEIKTGRPLILLTDKQKSIVRVDRHWAIPGKSPLKCRYCKKIVVFGNYADPRARRRPR
jgi:hybrid polyketide synthase / nonribosomal peptide synthetase ACE1